MRGALVFLFALSGSFAKAQTCTYDAKNKVFHFEPGKKIVLFFGPHGSPTAINEYVSSGNAHLASEVRKLLAKHSHSIGEMNMTFDRTLSIISKQKTSWIGFENSQESIDSLGGFKGLMDFLRNEDLRMHKLGLTEKERRDYLIIMTDPIVAAQYWFRFKKSGSLPNGNAETPATIGFDNRRDPTLDELSKKVMFIFVKYDEMRGKLNQPDVAMPAWVLEEFNTFKLGAIFSRDPHKAADFLRNVLADSRSATLGRQQKQKIEALRDFISSNADFIRATVLREDAEFAKRDQGIANDLSQLATLHGYGLVHIGGNHKEGVVTHLTQICQSRNKSHINSRDQIGNRGIQTRPPSKSGPVTR